MKTLLILITCLFSLSSFAELTKQPLLDDQSALEFQDLVRADSPSKEDFAAAGAGEPITRDQVLERAHSALNYRFYYAQKNSSSPRIKNSCSPAYGNKWLRPYHLNNKAGQTVSAIPYKWGGYFLDLNYFKTKLEEGRLAGDICTCSNSRYGYCLVYEAVGLDCSGFVSYAWKVPYHTTHVMHEISQRISWSQLRPGDAILHRTNHVMLFKNFVNRNTVKVIESSLTCNGLCESNHSIQRLSRAGYYPIRYNNIVD